MGVQIGTAFLATRECDRVSASYKQALVEAMDVSTVIVGSGLSPMRVIKNKLAATLQQMFDEGKPTEEIEALKNRQMSEFYRADDVDNYLFAAGQVAGLIKEVKTVMQLVQDIGNGAEEVYRSLS